MKQFVFSNAKFQDIKTKEYDELKRRMQSIDKDIEAVVSAIFALAEKFEHERESYNKACKEGIKAEKLRTYQWYFPYLRDQQQQLEQERQRLEEEKRKLQNMLIKIHNELKVLDQMREEQYADYLKEVAADEAKELDSLLSFTIYEGAV